MKELEGLLNKSSEEQKKGVMKVVNSAFDKKDAEALEKITQYGYFLVYL
jgi:hypothetical protein